MNITYDDMPPSAQKSYDINYKVRKVTLKLSWIASAILSIIFFIYFIIKGDDSIGTCFTGGIQFGCLLGCFLHGLAHSGFIFRVAFNGIKKCVVSLGILFGLFALIPFAFVICLPIYCGVFGFIFVVIDSILFWMEKRLIYKWENKHFLESKKAQEEMEA